MAGRGVEDRLRELAPLVLGALVRRYGQGAFDAAEDAVQEALLAAATRWPAEGLPDNPRAWLVTVASRRLVDQIRADRSRREREHLDAAATPQSALLAGAADVRPESDRDDSLTLLFLCCHPALSAPSQVALTLRAVGGLTTAQIAAAFLVPESTMAQRISRAKQTIRASGTPFVAPDDPAGGPANDSTEGPVAAARPGRPRGPGGAGGPRRTSGPGGAAGPAGVDHRARLDAVLHVLYLVFNEGYAATAGPDLTAPQLSDEAIRLTRWLWRLLPDEPEVAGLLALMLLTDARRPARTAADGSLVPLDEQDRGVWDHDLIAEGVELISAVLPRGAVGPYQVQAAIAAVHDEAPDLAATDWPQILGLYDLLERLTPGPMVRLNRAVALAMVRGPAAGLALLDELAADTRMTRHHRLLAARAHLLDLAGDRIAAAAAYRDAARRATSLPQRRYLTIRAARCDAPAGPGDDPARPRGDPPGIGSGNGGPGRNDP